MVFSLILRIILRLSRTILFFCNVPRESSICLFWTSASILFWIRSFSSSIACNFCKYNCFLVLGSDSVASIIYLLLFSLKKTSNNSVSQLNSSISFYHLLNLSRVFALMKNGMNLSYKLSYFLLWKHSKILMSFGRKNIN